MKDVRFKDAHLASFKTLREEEDGSLVIRGIGANYSLDREDEAFSDGAFSRGLSKFLGGAAPLCYHHKFDTAIGRVVDAVEVQGKGVEITAVVDYQEPNSPWRHIFNGIKAGRIASFSVGGIFKREGNRIVDVDILEWSATPVSVGRGTDFSVIAGKAVDVPMSKSDELEALREQVATMTKSLTDMKTTMPAGFTIQTSRGPQRTGAQTTRVGADDLLVTPSSARRNLNELERLQVESAWGERRTQIIRDQNRKKQEAEETGGIYNPVAVSVSAPDWFVKEWTGPTRTVREYVEGAPTTGPRQEIPLTPEQALAVEAGTVERGSILGKLRAGLAGNGTGSRLAPMPNGSMAAVDNGAVTHREISEGDRIVTRVERYEEALSPEQVFAQAAQAAQQEEEN